MSAPQNYNNLKVEEARALGLVECSTCGHRATTPGRHVAIGSLECPSGTSKFGPPLKRSWIDKDPREVVEPVPVFTPPPKARRVRRGI